MKPLESKTPVLLVQCCHLPQFFYIARVLKRQNPAIEFHALVLDHPQVRFYLDLFNLFDKVHLASEEDALAGYENVILPLLNRGYLSLKKKGASLPGKQWECGYDGILKELSRIKLSRSYLTAPYPADGNFVKFLKDFPHRPMGEEILVVRSADRSIENRCRKPLEKLLENSGNVTYLEADSFREAWRQLKGKSFDGAVIFCSGEKGFAHLKVLPFIRRIPKIAVFNEGGNYFYATAGGLLRFLAQRVRYGVELPTTIPCILLLQTEVREYVAGAAKTLRKRHLYPQARVVVLCKAEDSDYLRQFSEISEVIPYRKSDLLLKVFTTLRRHSPDIVSAVFTGRPVYRAMKIIFLALMDRPQLAFNAQLDGFWVKPGRWRQLREKGSLQYGLEKPPVQRVVVVQTEGLPYLEEILRQIRGPKFFPQAKITVISSEGNPEEISGLPEVDEVIRWRGWRHFLRLRKRVRRLHPEAAVGIFTGRPGYRGLKLLFLSFRKIPQCVFNARLDAYWLSRGTLRNLFRSEPLLFAQPERNVVLLQSEGWQSVAKAAEQLSSKDLFPDCSVVLFCQEDHKAHFENHPAISRLEVYSKPGIKGFFNDLKNP